MGEEPALFSDYVEQSCSNEMRSRSVAYHELSEVASGDRDSCHTV